MATYSQRRYWSPGRRLESDRCEWNRRRLRPRPDSETQSPPAPIWCKNTHKLMLSEWNQNQSSSETLHRYISPVHPGLEGLHRIQVDVSIVPPHCKDTPHHRGNTDSAPGRGQLRHILPVIGPGVEALHWAQRRIIIKPSFRQTQAHEAHRYHSWSLKLWRWTNSDRYQQRRGIRWVRWHRFRRAAGPSLAHLSICSDEGRSAPRWTETRCHHFPRPRTHSPDEDATPTQSNPDTHEQKSFTLSKQ